AARRSSYRVPRLDSGPAWADHRATARTSDRSPPLTRRDNVEDGLRFVDCDMHIMEPPDLFDRYLDPKFKHRVTVQVGADGQPKRGPSGLITIDGLPTSDMDLQQYRKRVRPAQTQSTQLLSNSRLFDTGRLDFAIERDYDPEAQVMGMAMEGVDIAVLYPTRGLALMGRNGM